MVGYAAPEPVTLVLGLIVIGGASLANWWRERGPDEDSIEYVDQLYTEGEIDLAEMERRKDVIQDPEATRIRNATERVSGIGEATSWAIAAEFDTLQGVREASIDRLTDISNVGEQRAAALKREL